MTDNTLPTAEYIRKRLSYDPATGEFAWRACEASPRKWNTRWAGTVAGTINPKGYCLINIDGKPHRAHRLAWLVTTGEWPADQLDHVNGNRSDNRIVNLRPVSNTENHRNTAMSKNNTSGHIGVCWDTGRCKWDASITVNYRKIHLGRFPHLSDAIAARRSAEITYGYHANHGRVAQMTRTA